MIYSFSVCAWRRCSGPTEARSRATAWPAPDPQPDDRLSSPRPERRIPLCWPSEGTIVAFPRRPVGQRKGSRMSDDVPDIVVARERIAPVVLRTLVQRHFETMVKFVADVELGVAAVGGELHADEEALLLELGSAQENLWGANYLPGRGPEACIEYTSLINIRPTQHNRSMEIEDEKVRARVREIAHALIGTGEPLP